MAEGVRRSNLGFMLAIAYLAVFAVAECLMLYDLAFHTAQSEFSGLGIIVVGLPWSLLLTPVASAVGYVGWYSRFAGTPLVYGLLASGTVLPGVLLNAGIAYWVGRVIGRTAGRAPRKAKLRIRVEKVTRKALFLESYGCV